MMMKLNVMSSDDEGVCVCVMHVSSFTSQQEATEELLSSLQHKHRGEMKLVHTPSGHSTQNTHNTVVHSVLQYSDCAYYSTAVLGLCVPLLALLG